MGEPDVFGELIHISKNVGCMKAKIDAIDEKVTGIKAKQDEHEKLIPAHCALLESLSNGNKKTSKLWDIFNQYKGAIWLLLATSGLILGYLRYFKGG